MVRDTPDDNLSQIATLWTVVRRAHSGPANAMQQARQELIDRYGGAARRYLARCMRDDDAAGELYQELALRLVSGGFQNADPQRGRFRQYFKTVLFHLMADYRRRDRVRMRSLPDEAPDQSPEPPPGEEADRCFVESWRDELLARTWARLAEVEQTSGSPVFTVLHFRAAHPEMRSGEMAEELSVQLGKPLSPEGVRQILHRARQRFARFMLDEVSQSLDDPSPDAIEAELIELGLLEYCRPAMEEHRRKETTP